MTLEVVHTTDVDKYIIANHYLHSAPAGARIRAWILDDNGHTIGAMMWGRPSARTYDPIKMLELTRLHLDDDTENYAESKALSMARRYIRKHYPQIKGLITYSSTGEGHKGTIYSADGWVNIGTTRAVAWNKPERANIDTSQKLRWFRTP